MESEWGIYANRCTIQIWIKKALNRTGKKIRTASKWRVWEAWERVFKRNSGYSDEFGRLTRKTERETLREDAQ